MELSIYQQIAEDVREKIKSGVLKPGDAIASENALCEVYGTSRMTVRKGLALLTGEGYITSIPGKGCFVKEPDVEKYILTYNEMSNLLEDVETTKLLEIGVVLPPPGVVTALNILPNRRIIMVKRLFYSGSGEPMAYDEKYLIYFKGMPIVEKELKYGTFPEMVSKFASVYAIKKELTISAQMPSEEIVQHLSLFHVQPLLVVEQKLFNAQTKPIGMGVTYYRGDYCRLQAHSG